MNSLSPRFYLACLATVAFLAGACSGVHTPVGGGGGGTTGPYSVSGSVTGLTGTGLVLQDNGGDNLTMNRAGTFTFATAVASGGPFAVTVLTQPTNPAQNCVVTGGSGTASAPVTGVTVACSAIVSATVGVNVTGLTGSGLVLQDNGGDSLTVTGNGASAFKTPVTGAYAVTVLTQPTSPAQICTVASPSGTATGDVTLNVSCVLSYTIGGTVTGVVGTGLKLQNTGGEQLPITANGAFTFVNQVPTGTPYTITISAQPTGPTQTCVITNGTASGTATSNITSVAVTCSAVTYSVGGTVLGLAGKHTMPGTNAPLTDNSFQLQDNGGDNLTVTQNGTFTFGTPVALNGHFAATVFTPPSTQNKPCWVFQYTGVVTANVTDIQVDCGHDDWTFIDGTKTAGTIPAPQYGLYTAPGATTPNPYTNTPGARDSGAGWTDPAGNLWLFGGLGWELQGNPSPDTLFANLNDLWECPIPTGSDYCQWKLVSDSTLAEFEDIPGTYGVKGVAAANNTPGGRWGSATWSDGAGNLYLFGGEGIDAFSGEGLLNDLWKYNISSGKWTWVSGSNSVDQQGVYSGAVFPGARWEPVYWTDASGNFWLFGGEGYDASGNLGFLNDLWKYSAGVWTFVGGGTAINQNGVYGTQGTPAIANIPGGRQTAVGWADASGHLWLFGGEGEDSAGTLNGILNDLWEYDIVSNKWTFVAGSKLANQTGTYGPQPQIGAVNTTSAAGTAGLTGPNPATFPGSRWGATAWTDFAGNFWLFGGWGQDSTGTNGNGFLNDLWVYTPNTNPLLPGTWNWVKGSNTGNANGNYGDLVRPYKPYVAWTPGGRRGTTHWVDATGELWMFGGQGYDATSTTGNGYLNDLWRYLPYP